MTLESTTAVAEPSTDAIVSGRRLVKHFPVRSKGFLRRKIGEVHAVCGVSLDIKPHKTLGLVGESGCGKSTTARLLLNLIPVTEGEVWYEGKDLTKMSRSGLQPVRRDLQIVFQDPYASLDPRMTVSSLIAEPLQIHGMYSNGGKQRVRDLLKVVGLNPEHGNRYPHEFSGGQRQRIGVARALALNPKVMILDEPVSALDVSIRAGVINLLENLQEELGLSYLFVSHDLSVVKHIAHDVAVMYLGKIVEVGKATDVFRAAAHPYTQALISAIPLPDPRKERARKRVMLVGDVPNPINPPSGCRFRTRCPKFANELSESEREACINETPRLTLQPEGTRAACHYAKATNMLALTE